MQRHVQIDVAERFFKYLKGRDTDFAQRELPIAAKSYFDDEYAARERDLVFRTRPIVVAHSSELDGPGSFVTRDIVGAPLLIVRQADGTLKAFSNVCRHRGAKVALEGAGCAQRFKCPYHAWTYNLDGSLKNIPFDEGFDGLDRSQYGLIELPVDERHGLVWAVATPGEPLDIAAMIGDEMDGDLSAFELDKYTLVREATYEEDMNWKVVADGFLDPYHLQFVHPKTVGPFFNTNVYTLDVLGPDVARLVVSRKSIHDIREQDPAEVDLLPHVICNYILLPNTFVAVEPRHFEVWTISPHPTDAQKCKVTLRFLLRNAPTTEREESYLEKNWKLLVHTVVDEDWGVGRALQAGLPHGQVKETISGRNEAPIQFLHGNLAAILSGDAADAMAGADEPYPRRYGNLVGEAS
ncbi:Carnitine monooxygenase oxygenase subunit [Paraconexibacter sp. AEG42_29]|uniref:Carnitine monooxygenase oxygenase subunit n=1 Tax=Paraconexibacter sp. AEG42_29 TaxID=2997339 RepID=A0AAU7API7_9ACTN